MHSSSFTCLCIFSDTVFILINALSLVSSPLTFKVKKMTKSHTKWLQEISVYLPIFSLKNVIVGLLNCSAPLALIRIKRSLFCWRRKHKKSGNIAVLYIYLSIYSLILRNCIIFPLNDYIFKLRRYAHSRKEFWVLNITSLSIGPMRNLSTLSVSKCRICVVYNLFSIINSITFMKWWCLLV